MCQDLSLGALATFPSCLPCLESLRISLPFQGFPSGHQGGYHMGGNRNPSGLPMSLPSSKSSYTGVIPSTHFHPFFRRSLNIIWKSIYNRQEDIFVLDIIFLLIPLICLWVCLFGNCRPSKSSIFSKNCKCWILTDFVLERNENFWTLFSSGFQSDRKQFIDMNPKPDKAKNTSFS